jgi:protein-disulfide isomerase
MLILAGSIAGSAIWFTILQKWIIGQFCIYCMTTHSIGFLLSIAIIWQAFKNSKINIARPLVIIGFVLIGLIPAGAIAILQTNYTPPTVFTDGETQSVSTTIDYNNSPIVGSPDATYIINLLFDYQCPHCQKLHFFLDEATHRYDGKLAFAICPTPLNNQCNSYIPPEADAYKNSCELTRISMAVWVADQVVFYDFDTWMFSFDSGSRWQPRTPEAAMAKALELVGQENFDKAYSDPWIDQYIQTCVQIYGHTIRSGNGGVPKMIFGSNWVIPEPYSVDDLILILQESLAIPKPGS